VEQGVLRVEQPIELAASPACLHLDADLQCRTDASDHGKRNTVDVAALNSGNQRVGDGRSRAELTLRPPSTDSDRSDDATELEVVHAGILARSPYLAVDAKFPWLIDSASRDPNPAPDSRQVTTWRRRPVTRVVAPAGPSVELTARWANAPGDSA